MTIELERFAQSSQDVPAPLLRILTMGFPPARVAQLRRAAAVLTQLDLCVESSEVADVGEPPVRGRRHDVVVISAALATEWFAGNSGSSASSLGKNITAIIGGPIDSTVARRAVRCWGFTHVLDIDKTDAVLFLKVAIMASLQRLRTLQTELMHEALGSLNRTLGREEPDADPIVIIDESHRIRFANIAAQNLPAATLSRIVRNILTSRWPPVEAIVEDLDDCGPMGDMPGTAVATRAVLGAERMTILRLHTAVSRDTGELLGDRLREIDPLTGLPNREAFVRSVSTCLAAAEPKSCGGMLLVNLRGLRKFGASLGPLASGSMIMAMLHRIRSHLGNNDLLAHFDDDSFAIWINDAVDPAALRGFAGELLQELQRPFILESGTAELTVGIGISVYPDDGTSVAALLSNADIALRRAQRRGAGQVELFDTRAGRNIVRRGDRFQELQRAMERDEFGVVFQPEFNGNDTRLAGAETLLRWTDANGRSHAPSEFVPLLEQSGLISEIGDRILREACSRARAWQKSEGVDLRVSVNLSPQQLLDRSFVSRLTGILDETGLPADLLELEIPEKLFLQLADTAAGRLHDLADLGVRILIDDFGTGLSSISYLKSLPLSGIKIDRCFVSGIEHNLHDRALIQAMIDLAVCLNLSVIGEGVESVMQALRLQEMGIGRLQGYLFAPGLSSDEFTERFLQPFTA
jgi:diguanylate cyclase (GGDEF)-like protein